MLPIILVLAFRSLTRDSRQEVLGTRAVDGQSHCPLSSLVAHSQWQPFIDGPVYSDTQLGYSTGLVAGALFNLDTLLGLARSEITHWKTKVDFLFHELYLLLCFFDDSRAYQSIQVSIHLIQESVDAPQCQVYFMYGNP